MAPPPPGISKLGSDRHSSFSVSAASVYSTIPRHHRDKSETSAINLKKEQQQFISLSNIPTEKLSKLYNSQ